MPTPTPIRPTTTTPLVPHVPPAPRPDRSWARAAACDGTDPALFDPVNRHVAERATAVCAACPVRRACLLEALTDESDSAYGPWLVRGGLTPKERRDLSPHERSALVADLRVTAVGTRAAPAAVTAPSAA
jgi:WhiB family redox-sensing transcriptional regulator